MAIQIGAQTNSISIQTDDILNDLLDLTCVTPNPTHSDILNISDSSTKYIPIIHSHPTIEDLELNLNRIREDISTEVDPVTDAILQLLLEKRNSLVNDIDLLDSAVDALHS